MSRNGRNRRDEDNSFREWLSDHLRYLVLFIALLLALIVAAMVGSLLDTTGNLSFFGNREIVQNETSPEPEIVIISNDQIQAETQEPESESEGENGRGASAFASTPGGTQGIGITDIKPYLNSGDTEQPGDLEETESQRILPILPSGSSNVSGMRSTVTNLDTGESAASFGNGIPESQAESVSQPETSASQSGNELIVQRTEPETSVSESQGASQDDSPESVPETSPASLPESSPAAIPETSPASSGESYSEESSGSGITVSGGSPSGTMEYTSSGEENADSSAEPVQDAGTASYSSNLSTPETQAPTYLTMTGTCYLRSYPDYGDNILGTYGAGTVVRFYGEEAGWYKVEVDGQIGYMGPRFFR